ncbi:MAG: zinc-dependent alcohol dehydrogenase family protein [Acidobacteriota bacterium]
MKAVIFEQFGVRPELCDVPDPVPPADGVVLQVMATGVCRSDWHGWMGHDPDIRVPHVPGHELAGIVIATGAGVRHWRIGDRVTVPFVCGCGACAECQRGDQQVCRAQYQPGFTHWGSFAEYVAIHRADLNLVRLPEGLDFEVAASLGCRFTTSFRAVVDQGRVGAGEWVVVYGCGGVGLSAVMIASASGARVVAVDIAPGNLALARELGAEVLIEATLEADLPAAVIEATGGGAHLSIDALGSVRTCVDAISSLRRRGRHVQVGLMVGRDAAPPIPLGRVIGYELEILGSHGMAAHRFPAVFGLMATGRLEPGRLIRRRVSLAGSIEALVSMDRFEVSGVTVITAARLD